jgi:copper chaperone
MIEFEVKDMTCGHCVETITRVVKETAPTASVDIQLARHRVRVDGVSDPGMIEHVIREVGYTPVIVPASPA